VNKELESKNGKGTTISSLVLSIRQKEKIKVRQPLQKINDSNIGMINKGWKFEAVCPI